MSPGTVVSDITDRLADWLGVAKDNLAHVLVTVGVVVAYIVARRIAVRMIGSRFDDSQTRYRINKISQAVFLAASLFILVKVWFKDLQFGTYLGLLSAGIAVALQDPLVNAVAWLYIVARSPFRVGDRIQIGPHAGDVVDVHVFNFSLLEIGNWVHADQSTGRIIHVPNGWIFKQPLASYDLGFPFIWNEIQVTVTFESDWRKAKSCLEDVLAAVAEKVEDDHFDRPSHGLDIRYARLTPVVWTSTSADGVVLTMRYLCKPRERRVSTSRIWEKVLDAFQEIDSVDLAYPTTRYYDATTEGKSRSGAARETADARPAGAAPRRDPSQG
jgi:small-conductance mechanosensitive channel